MDYNEAEKIALTAKDQRKGKPVGNSLRLILEPNLKCVRLRHHNTNIISYYSNGNTIIYNGGWYSVTTKKFMNKYLPKNIHLYQKNHEWYIETKGMIFEYKHFMNVSNLISMLLDNEVA